MASVLPIRVAKDALFFEAPYKMFGLTEGISPPPRNIIFDIVT